MGFLPFGVMTDLRHTTVAMTTSNVTPDLLLLLLLLRQAVFSVRDALRSIMQTVHVCCVEMELRLSIKFSIENIIQHITTDYSTASFIGRCFIRSSNQALISSHSCHLFVICCITCTFSKLSYVLSPSSFIHNTRALSPLYTPSWVSRYWLSWQPLCVLGQSSRQRGGIPCPTPFACTVFAYTWHIFSKSSEYYGQNLKFLFNFLKSYGCYRHTDTLFFTI